MVSRASIPPGLFRGVCLFLVLCPGTGYGRVLRVEGASFEATYSIQAAIDSASPGDTLEVGPGVYQESLDLRGKAVYLRSRLGPEVTILDGTGSQSSVVTCASGERSSTIIEGFTIRNGQGTLRAGFSRYGGGILCLDSAPTIRGNIIEGNSASGGEASWGGGIFLYLAPAGAGEGANISNNMIRDNFASGAGGGAWLEGKCNFKMNVVANNSVGHGDGGGLVVFRAPVVVLKNLFSENSAGDHGGAINVTNRVGVPPEEIILRENIIIGNQSRTTLATNCSGGGVFVDGGAYIIQNTIIFNKSEAVSAPAAGGICLYNTEQGALVERNIIYRNQGGEVYGAGVGGSRILRNIFGENCTTCPTSDGGYELETRENIYADPMLCGPEPQGEVAGASPALNQSFGVIGAVARPGCAPYLDTSIKHTTWGRLKVRY